MDSPSNAELAPQVINLGQQVQQLTAQLQAAQATITTLQSAPPAGTSTTPIARKEWAGLVEKKQMLPETFSKREFWKEWAEMFIDYVEEFSKPMAYQLEVAARHEDIITPTFVNEDCRKIAEACYNILRKLVREPDGRRLVRASKSSRLRV